MRKLAVALTVTLLLLVAGANIQADGETPEPATTTDKPTAALCAKARKAMESFKALEFTALYKLMPEWQQERVALEQAKAQAALDADPELKKNFASILDSKGSPDPDDKLKLAEKGSFAALKPEEFFALDYGFLRMHASVEALTAARGQWFLVDVRRAVAKEELTRAGTTLTTDEPVQLVVFENARKDRVDLIYCEVDGETLLWGWDISVAGFAVDSSKGGHVAILAGGYDDGWGRLDEPVGKCRVTHILVKVGDTVKPAGKKRSAEEARVLCEDLWKQYKNAPDDEKEKVWYDLQEKYNEDGQAHNPYDVTPAAGFIPGFKEVALSTEVGKARICAFDKQKSPYGYHLIRREK